MKTCTKCNFEQPNENYPFRNKKENVLHNVCKECHRQYSKSHYKNNPEKYKSNTVKRQITNRTENKEFVRTYKLSTGCKFCPEKEPIALDFHHLHDKKYDISTLTKNHSMKALLAEIKKCIVVCSNCHRKIHAGIITIPA